MTGIKLRSGLASVQGLIDADAASSTTLRVIASSKPAGRQDAANPLEHPIVALMRRRHHRHANVLGNRVVAVDSPHFLDEIDFAGQVARQLGGTNVSDDGCGTKDDGCGKERCR